jgi:hypothetical protein
MTHGSSVSSLQDGWEHDAFPDAFSKGATVLIASAGDPARYDVDFNALCTYRNKDDTALVVTTTESASATLDTYERLCADIDCPSPSFVDTTATQPTADSLYGGTPVVYIPSPGDIERLVLALSDLSENQPVTNGNRHLVIRSLSPIITSTSTERVCSILDRITGLRTEHGLSLLGIDYTAHDDETVTALAQQVDGVLWVTESSPTRLGFEYRPTNR